MTIQAQNILNRLKEKDPSLWPDGNVSQTRLGWLDIAERMSEQLDELKTFADKLNDCNSVYLLGMGGSSLGAALLGQFSKSRALHVIDSTHPATVATIDNENSLYVVSSKSGTTLEPNVLMQYALEITENNTNRFVAITDPGTELERIANNLGFKKVFYGDPNIGGRYSVLSAFGLVPGALVGCDIEDLLAGAQDVDWLEAVELGIKLGDAANDGVNKLCIITEPYSPLFGFWVEQLIAESTGKNGKGIVPVPSENLVKRDDVIEIQLTVSNLREIGYQIMRLEIATAIAGSILNIDPFNEPNVAESKKNTADVLANGSISEDNLGSIKDLTSWISNNLTDRDYVSLQCYFPIAQISDLLDLKRRAISLFTNTPITAGFGPRFLHSTGQLHKGGPNEILAVQILDDNNYNELAIPGQSYSFNFLIRAQAYGDFLSLQNHKRRVIRLKAKTLSEIFR